MARIYYSAVLDVSADAAWALVRDFNDYPAYIDGVSESRIENDRAGDAVGAVRSFVYHGRHVRQRLLAHSDVERSFTYGSCEPFAFPASRDEGNGIESIDYEGTLRIKPVMESGKAFVEWWVSLDAGSADRRRWTRFFEEGLRQWMGSLAGHLGERPSAG